MKFKVQFPWDACHFFNPVGQKITSQGTEFYGFKKKKTLMLAYGKLDFCNTFEHKQYIKRYSVKALCV